jgi:hypothetical protein
MTAKNFVVQADGDRQKYVRRLPVTGERYAFSTLPNATRYYDGDARVIARRLNIIDEGRHTYLAVDLRTSVANPSKKEPS